MKNLNHVEVLNMLKQEESAFWEYVKHRDDIKRILNNLLNLKKAEFLLKESVAFMNLVPNRKYGDNYELCSRIDKFLKELDG